MVQWRNGLSALASEPCLSSLPLGCVCTWVSLYPGRKPLLPSCLCWENQTTVSRNHCSSGTSAFRICDNRVSKSFPSEKSIQIAFVFDRLLSSACFSQVVIFFFQIFLLLNILLCMWPWTLGGFPSSLMVSSPGCPNTSDDTPTEHRPERNLLCVRETSSASWAVNDFRVTPCIFTSDLAQHLPHLTPRCEKVLF